MKRLSLFVLSLLAPIGLIIAILSWIPVSAQENQAVPALSVTLTGPRSAVGNTPFAYTLVVTNTGSPAATQVVVTNTVPAGATYVAGGTFDGSVVSWNVGALPPGTSQSVSYTVTITDGVTNDDFGATSTGGIATSGTDSVLTLVRWPTFDLSLSAPTAAVANLPFTYTLTFTNAGYYPVENIVLSTTVPANATYVSGGTFDGVNVTWPLAVVDAGETVELYYQAKTTVPITATQLGVRAGADPAGLVILDESLLPGWINLSWLTTVNFAAPSPVLFGAQSTAVTFDDAWAGFYLHTNAGPVDRTGFESLRFYVHGGSTGGHNLSVAVVNENDEAPLFLPFTTVANSWSLIEFPLSALGDPAAIEGIMIADTSGVPQPTFYIDGLVLMPDHDKEIALHTFVGTPDVTISKRGPATFGITELITYTLVISNSGSATLNQLQVFDKIPAGSIWIAGGTLNGNEASWLIPTLEPGEFTEVQLTVSATETIVNDTYKVTTAEDVSDVGDVSVVSTFVEPILEITKTGPESSGPNSPIIYTIVLSNTGDGPAVDVVVTDTIPIGATYRNGGSFDGIDTVSWTIPRLNPGVTIELNFSVTAEQDIINDDYAAVAAGGYRAVGADAVSTQYLVPVLAISKTGPATTTPASPITYLLTITNSGTFPAANIIITDRVPVGAHYVSGGTIGGDGVVSWEIPSIAPLTSIQVQFIVTATQTITNTDYAVTSEAGFSAVGEQVVRTDYLAPDLEIHKSAPAFAFIGEPITYTLVVTNSGLSPAVDLVVEDMVPAGANYVTGGAHNAGIVSWQIASLAPGENVQLEFVVTATATIVNEDYRVIAAFGFHAIGAESVETIVTEQPIPILQIGKTAPEQVASGDPIEYTLTITNTGNGVASSLRITDTLPIGAHYVTGGTLVGDTVEWLVDSLEPGSAVRVSFIVTATETIFNEHYGVVALGGAAAVGTEAVPTIVVPPMETVLLPATILAGPPGEPNNSCNSAHELDINVPHQFLADDVDDWYYFELATSSNLDIVLTNFVPLQGQIILWFAPNGDCNGLIFIGNNGNGAATKVINAGVQPAGRYYIWLINDGPQNLPDPYTLLITTS